MAETYEAMVRLALERNGQPCNVIGDPDDVYLAVEQGSDLPAAGGVVNMDPVQWAMGLLGYDRVTYRLGAIDGG